jgi:succinate dehydrogenase subunit C
VNVRLYLLQRGSAAVMLPLVLLHLGVIFYASRRGLSAADILARTRGSLFWGTSYAAFVVAAATHAAIGVRVIAAEWAGWRGGTLEVGMWSFGLLLAALGLIAVAAVVLA